MHRYQSNYCILEHAIFLVYAYFCESTEFFIITQGVGVILYHANVFSVEENIL